MHVELQGKTICEKNLVFFEAHFIVIEVLLMVQFL